MRGERKSETERKKMEQRVRGEIRKEKVGVNEI